MINLLPPEVKSNYQYARRAVGLRRWVIMFSVALLGLGVLSTYGLVSLQRSTVQYKKQIAAADAVFQKENFTGTQKQVEDISNSFKLVVKVLSQEVLFSELLKQIAATIPDKANLTSLNISQTQGAIDISAMATDYNTATQVQVNLADPDNKIFSKADIVNISCGSTNSTNPNYPCTVTIRALFAKNNPFLFINSKGTTP
ncbi:MAG: PilN domain-containing protein [Patescibacteria group bacterium]